MPVLRKLFALGAGKLQGKLSHRHQKASTAIDKDARAKRNYLTHFFNDIVGLASV